MKTLAKPQRYITEIHMYKGIKLNNKKVKNNTIFMLNEQLNTYEFIESNFEADEIHPIDRLQVYLNPIEFFLRSDIKENIAYAS